jgi:hypothetical protein
VPTLPAYAALHCLTNFTVLRSASQAEALMVCAQALGYSAQITDKVGSRVWCARMWRRSRSKPPSSKAFSIRPSIGGVFAEICKDFAARLAPVNVEDVAKMIEQMKSLAPIRGYRGTLKSDCAAPAKR